MKSEVIFTLSPNFVIILVSLIFISSVFRQCNFQLHRLFPSVKYPELCKIVFDCLINSPNGLKYLLLIQLFLMSHLTFKDCRWTFNIQEEKQWKASGFVLEVRSCCRFQTFVPLSMSYENCRNYCPSDQIKHEKNESRGQKGQLELKQRQESAISNHQRYQRIK